MRTLSLLLQKHAAMVLVALIAPAITSAAQEGMDLALENKLDNLDNLGRDFKFDGELKVVNHQLRAEAAEVKNNASLKTLGAFRDFLVEFELVLHEAQKGSVCIATRANTNGACLFYIYPQGLLRITSSIKTEPVEKYDDLATVNFALTKDEPYKVKVCGSGSRVAMKIWLASEPEPNEWNINAEDQAHLEEGNILIEIQRHATPGSYSAELANLRIWTRKAK
ncbi:MAG: hypothetical protein HY360_18065 [Verrucomicrobia bacterium]|nr:hypothetical protein [Verrucomicrobiota bacterium]